MAEVKRVKVSNPLAVKLLINSSGEGYETSIGIPSKC